MNYTRYGSRLLLLSAVACQTAEPKLGVAEQYFPSASHLEQGVVNKYYAHVDPGEGQGTYTDIIYKSYRMVAPHQLVANTYNAGFERNRTRTFT